MKEMTEMGPRRKIGDVLAACMHRAFTVEADMYLEMGFLSQDERIALSNAVGRALDAFNESAPAEVANRYLDPPYHDMEEGEASLPLYLRIYNVLEKALGRKKQKPPELPSSSLALFKDTSGQWWMIGIYSNRFKDREDDILSESAHDDYAKWFQESGIKPVVTLLHYPRMPEQFWVKVWETYKDNIPVLNDIIQKVYKNFAVAEAQRVTVLNGFTIVVSKVYAGKEKIAQNLAAMVNKLGMSHGFMSLQKTDKVIDIYRTFEFTILPKARAANLLTQPFFAEAKEMPVSKADRDFFEQAGLPVDVLEGLDKATAEAFEQLAPILAYKDILLGDADMKDNTTQVAAPTTPQEEVIQPTAGAPEGANDPQTSEVQANSYEQIRDQLTKDFNLEGLNAILTQMSQQLKTAQEEIVALKGQLEAANDQVKSLKVDEDQKIAAMFAPPSWGMGHSPASDEKNIIPTELAEALKKDAPGQQQKLTESSNPLQAMLWGPMLNSSGPVV